MIRNFIVKRVAYEWWMKSCSTLFVEILCYKNRERTLDMAYAAVNSLAVTINRLLNCCRILIIEIIAFEDDELEPLRDVLLG